jgi:hypothetical protein
MNRRATPVLYAIGVQRAREKAPLAPYPHDEPRAPSFRQAITAAASRAREDAKKADREDDRAEAEAWSLRMEGFGGPAQPSPTTGQCLNGGLGRLEVECNRCKTRASA